MSVIIPKNSTYARSTVTIVGITRTAYGRPQYILVEADNKLLKFPGLRFRAPQTSEQTLEDVAKARFEEQTGLTMDRTLGLRTIMPTRNRHNNEWIFRNIFYGVVENPENRKENDIGRKVYVADPGQGYLSERDQVAELGNSDSRRSLDWVFPDNQVIARSATNVLNHFDWENYRSDWDHRIPCLGSSSLTDSSYRPLGSALAVASMLLIYRPSVDDSWNIILLQKKGDQHPGYAGGKIETPASKKNLDPISCCVQEGEEEYGFSIQPRALVGVAVTPLEVPDRFDDSLDSSKFYNAIVNYAFVAEPTNPEDVACALRDPSTFLEPKMERYVVETLDEHRDRIGRRELRMPDMVEIGKQFYKTSPGSKIPLTQIRASGMM